MGRTVIRQPGEAGRINQHQDVERIAVVAQGTGDESVITGIVNRRVEIAVEAKDVQRFVVFVFVSLPSGNLDDCVNFIGRAFTNRQRKIICHDCCPVRKPEKRLEARQRVHALRFDGGLTLGVITSGRHRFQTTFVNGAATARAYSIRTFLDPQ